MCLIAVLENVLDRCARKCAAFPAAVVLCSIPGVFLCLSFEHTRSKTGKYIFIYCHLTVALLLEKGHTLKIRTCFLLSY